MQLDWADVARPRAVHPFIRPGEPLLFYDLTRVPFPGQVKMSGTFHDGSRFEPCPVGALLHVVPKRAVEGFDNSLRSRDGCVRAAFTALDPLVTFSCLARSERFGAVRMRYSLQVDCQTRRVRLSRGFSGDKVAAFADLVPFTACPALHPTGTQNVIELRTQGATLEARVNDQHVATIHDPVLGIGSFGIRAEAALAATVPQRLVATWFEVRQVIA